MDQNARNALQKIFDVWRINPRHLKENGGSPMDWIKRPEQINHRRRRFLGSAAMTLAAAHLFLSGPAIAQPGKAKPADLPRIKPGANKSFGPLKQIDAGLLNVGYAEAGSPHGRPVILLPAWPSHIHP